MGIRQPSIESIVRRQLEEDRKQLANSRQVGGKHYQKAAVQHWDFVEMHKIPYMEAQIMKYLMRWRDKGGVQDLEKAKHFLEKLIEQQK